ncbi:MAG: hypothetical protein QM702_15180 [Rubrivivax sp.]
MRTRSAPVTFAGFALASAAVAADGLVPPETDQWWPRWQARAQLGATTLAPVTLTGGTREAGSLLGDYYFGNPGLRVRSWTGGLRATGGLAFGGRGLPLGPQASLRTSAGALPVGIADDTDAVPYFGVGYSGSTRDGWSFSADIGLVADRPGSLRAGRVLFGDQPLDNALREMQFAPVLQLGVRYSF